MRFFGAMWRPAYAGAGCCPPAGASESECGPQTANVSPFEGWFGEATPFGVRRPLRFLAYKLSLDDEQVKRLAEILDELKTERAQAAVDDRRTMTSFAESVTGETFDAKRADEGGALRTASAERLRTAVVSALERIHKMLNADQRAKLAYLIRTGTLTL